MAQRRSKKIRYAVVGLGHIAQIAVLPAFAHAKKNTELVALVSGDHIKLKKISKQYVVEHTYSYEQYDQLLSSDLIDAVYICLPNHLHMSFAIRAMEKGIHVLCEKPIALNTDEAKRMIEGSQRNDVKLMTAYRLHFQEANLKVLKMVRSGELGDVRFFNSTFSMRISDKNIRLQALKGGGTLYDIGIYCINAVRNIFGELPEEVFAFSNTDYDKRFSEVDEMCSVSMKFSKGRLANFITSFSTSPTASYDVVGTMGRIHLEQAYEYFGEMTLTHAKPQGKERVYKFKKSDQFAPEIVYFSDCIQKNRQPEASGVEGLLDLMVIQALYKSARTGRPVKLQALRKDQVLSPKQKMRRPPVKKPQLINVSSPSRD